MGARLKLELPMRIPSTPGTPILMKALIEEEGERRPATNIQWFSADPRVLGVEGSRVMVRGSGATVLKARSGDLEAQIEVIVPASGAAQALKLRVSKSELYLGESVPVAVYREDRVGTWDVTRKASVVVEPHFRAELIEGRLVAHQPGPIRLLASLESLQASLDLHILAEPPPGGDALEETQPLAAGLPPLPEDRESAELARVEDVDPSAGTRTLLPQDRIGPDGVDPSGTTRRARSLLDGVLEDDEETRDDGAITIPLPPPGTGRYEPRDTGRHAPAETGRLDPRRDVSHTGRYAPGGTGRHAPPTTGRAPTPPPSARMEDSGASGRELWAMPIGQGAPDPDQVATANMDGGLPADDGGAREDGIRTMLQSSDEGEETSLIEEPEAPSGSALLNETNRAARPPLVLLIGVLPPSNGKGFEVRINGADIKRVALLFLHHLLLRPGLTTMEIELRRHGELITTDQLELDWRLPKSLQAVGEIPPCCLEVYWRYVRGERDGGARLEVLCQTPYVNPIDVNADRRIIPRRQNSGEYRSFLDLTPGRNALMLMGASGEHRLDFYVERGDPDWTAEKRGSRGG